MWTLGDVPHPLNNVSISQHYFRQDELQQSFLKAYNVLNWTSTT